MKHLVMIGGGVYLARCCEALAASNAMPEQVTLHLVARRHDRLRIISNHIRQRLHPHRPNWIIRDHGALEEALDGADLIVPLVRVGGLAARKEDEHFPAKLGEVGDEGLGLGGIANGWRTFPVLAEMCAVIKRIAPNARILNMMAPLGLTTRYFLDEGLEAVGVCELPLLTQRKIEQAGFPQRTTLHYAGLNHLGFFWSEKGVDCPVLTAAARSQIFDQQVYQTMGAGPLHYYDTLFDQDAAQRLGRQRKPGRAQQLMDLTDDILEQMRSRPGAAIEELDLRPTPWFDQALAPIAAAFLGGPPADNFINLSNEGRLPELPDQAIVELAATIGTTVKTQQPGPMPPAVAAFLQSVCEAERLTYSGCRQRDPSLLAQAIRALPLPIAENPSKIEEACQAITGTVVV